MTTEIKAPTFPESVQDGTIATWHKQSGDTVKRDELLVDIETDKVVLEVVAPADGILQEVLKAEGDTVLSNEVIARIDDAVAEEENEVVEVAEDPASAPAVEASDAIATPSARRRAESYGIELSKIKGSGRNGLITPEDVDRAAAERTTSGAVIAQAPEHTDADLTAASGRIEKRVPMTRMRKRIAERLLQATQNTAMLTTFNEVNMAPIMEIRNKYKSLFEKTHSGTRLGFMGFFVKAAAEALRSFPSVNASIDGDDVVYHGYQDIGVAVSTPKGLVVPILRNAEHMSIASIENTIRDYSIRAQDGRLSIEEMTGGTFSITNGGVFGSMLSTPILNPPQTAILGMHKIQDRAMVVDGEITILPMMYLALSYDHRLIDGREAVQFLATIKDTLEDPARILLEI